MIDRILIKDYLNFKNVELNFKEGLSVFTGVSGAGNVGADERDNGCFWAKR